ncbi:tetratricopeptide repeat protein [Pajaroellobacter abortibovis]|nr:tetratricopeptide repeat protein [Pajaroellobacter abortibovis]
MQEFEEASPLSSSPYVIDLAMVMEAEAAAARSEWSQIILLLGAWPVPLIHYWRTPEGKALAPQSRLWIARGLELLGLAHAVLGEWIEAGDILRLATKYVHQGPAAASIFATLGRIQFNSGREGEAIGYFRRALALGFEAQQILPLLAQSFFLRKCYVAAIACLEQAVQVGVPRDSLNSLFARVEKRLGAPLREWRKGVQRSVPPPPPLPMNKK